MNRIVSGTRGRVVLMLSIVPVAGFAAGCGDGDSQSAFSRQSRALAPAGSAASFTANSVPTSMAPGERINASVTVQNTGTVDWDPTSEWRLRSPNFDFEIANLFFSAPVLQGGSQTVRFVLTAPPANATFGLSVFSSVPGFSGDVPGTLSIPVTVDAMNQPQYGCTFVSTTLSNPIAAGSFETIDVEVQNSGSLQWPGGSEFCLYARENLDTTNPDFNRWGTQVCVPVTSPVNSLSNFTFQLPIAVPSVPGTYRFMRQIRDGRTVANGGISFFSLDEFCVDESISVVAATPNLDAISTSNTVPATVAPNSTVVATATFRNDGTTTWTPGNFSLRGLDSTEPLFRNISVGITSNVPQNSSVQFSFSISTPSSPSSETLSLQMFQSGIGLFGTRLDVPITISAAVTPPLDATVASQTIPTSLEADEITTFSIEMQNTGTDTWPADGTISLRSLDNPSDFSTILAPLATSTSSGATATFTFVTQAPSAVGTYSSRWQLFSTAVGFFGSQAITNGITVSAPAGCGDGSVTGAETCDDGGTTPNDGCSGACQIEAVSLDLSTDSANRTFFGRGFNTQLSSSFSGDLNNDGIDDLIVTDYSTVVVPGFITRPHAGRAYVFFGSSGFFTQSTEDVSTNPDLVVYGRENLDFLGGTFGGAAVGDVTGDGNPDLVVGARLADGTTNSQSEVGEAYVLVGGATLYGGGVFNLGSVPAGSPDTDGNTTILGTTFEGEAAGDQLSVLAVGDVTNDGVDDVILASNLNASATGEVYVIAGGSSLANTSTVSLASATITARLQGPTTSALFGSAAAIADLTGDGINDLVVSAPNLSVGGLTRNGAVYVITGPVSGNLPMSNSGNYRTRYVGEASHVLYGTDLAAGDVTADGAPDLVVGAGQASEGVLQVGNVHVWRGPLAAGEVDTAVTAPNGSDIYGNNKDFVGGSVELTDANGDNVQDILFGAGLADGPSDARNSCGEMGLLTGGNLTGRVNFPVVIAPFRVQGAAVEDGMGYTRPSLSAGDFNNDGRGDWCLGSRTGGDSVAPNAGRIDCFESPW